MFSDREKQACENKIRDLSHNTTYSIDLARGFRTGVWDAWMAILLLYLRNLEKINFEVFDGSPEYLPKALHHAAQLQHDGSLHIEGSLSKLQIIILASQDPLGVNILYFLAFVAPKSVKNAFVYALENEGREVRTNGQVFQTESLTLQNSTVDGDALVHLLKCFPKIKHFDYDHGQTIFNDNQFIPKKVGESIQHLTETLETLAINGKDPDEDVEDIDQYSIGSLTKFRKLRALKLSVRALLGDPDEAGNSDNNETIERNSLIGLLPSSIEELTLTQCKGKELRCISELSSNRNELPLLQRVLLDCIGMYPAPVEEFQKANGLCGSVGILLLANL
ncbi:hypothetical protein B0O99DRAFT_599819 [Bisporella sp. PMI_857]|nr:hypothetical protein B0O99DRAFT_599819 [Bisporella sp. PMI_857]